MSLEDLFDELEANTSPRQVLRAPFGWPGGKSRSLDYIIPKLPNRKIWVDVFGGSGAVTLARHKSKLEVFNDRYSGVVAFYRCVKHRKKFDALCDWLEHTVHSREDFVWSKETWENCEDDVERAARWYYMVSYSFGGLGRNFGRATSPSGTLSGKIRNNLKLFPKIHDRFKNIQVENQDWYQCLCDYDSPDTVFYLDPPYIDADSGIYKEKDVDYYALIRAVFNCEGFVALSGYSNPVFENQDWDERYEWESYVSIQSLGGKGNYKDNIHHLEQRKKAKEVLWIKS